MDKALDTQLDAGRLTQKLERERLARKQAEDVLEEKSRELFEANRSLHDSIQKAKNDSARLNAIMNSLNHGVIVTDCHLNILDANIPCGAMLGISRKDLVGLSLTHFISEDQLEDYQAFGEEVLEMPNEELEHFDLEFEFRDANEKPFMAEVVVSTFQHDDEHFLLHLIRDVSSRKKLEVERKQMQQELAHAAKWEAVGQLAGGIAHEINTPSQYIGDNLRFLSDCTTQVFTILMNSLALQKACRKQGIMSDEVAQIDNLIEEYDLDYLIEEVPVAFKQTSDGIAQISRIVLAMKNFSHPGTKDKQLLDLNNAIETTLTVSRNEWKNIAEVDLDLDDTLPAVNCIPGAINQVFLNIIVNAAHAIEASGKEGFGKIGIKTSVADRFAEIRISDSGTGIPKQYQKDIFNPFFTTKEVGKGTGQGLAIAHDIIVEKHKGTISFETEDGVGTTFILKLPFKTK